MTSLELAQLLARQRVDDGEPLDRVAEHLDAQHRLVVGRVDLDGVAPDPELAPPERQVVAVVLQVDQAAQDRALVVVDAGVELQQLARGTRRGRPCRRCRRREATTITSRRVRRAAVAEWRSRSISSLIDESFSM